MLITLGPFIVGFVLAAFTPIMVSLVTWRLKSRVIEDLGKAGATPDSQPLCVRPEAIADYAAYSVDAAQAFLIPIATFIGALLIISSDVPTAVAVIFILVGLLAAFWLFIWMLGQEPMYYVGNKWLRVSKITVAGIIVNTVAIITISASS